MQKNAYKIIALTLLLMLLCGCKQSRSLGDIFELLLLLL